MVIEVSTIWYYSIIFSWVFLFVYFLLTIFLERLNRKITKEIFKIIYEYKKENKLRDDLLKKHFRKMDLHTQGYKTPYIEGILFARNHLYNEFKKAGIIYFPNMDK